MFCLDSSKRARIVEYGSIATWALALGCSRNQAPPVTPTPSAPVATEVAPTEDSTFVVSESVRLKCSLPEARPDTPQFDFDQAELRPRGMAILDAIATCVSTGSLKGSGVTLIGHTDSRGTEAYNEDLGMQRAAVARDYLTSKGVAGSSIIVKSAGEQDATGHDESSHQLDRRVEIDESAP